jgi:hypothetical protein
MVMLLQDSWRPESFLLQGGLIFKEYSHDKICHKLHLCGHTTWFIMKIYEDRVIDYCTKDFNQAKTTSY